MKLQGKNADIAVPTIRKNLRQPWELSPRAGEGEQGTRTGPSLQPHGLDRAGKASRSPSLLGKAVLELLQCCSHAALQLLSQEAEFANQSNGLEVSEVFCLHKTRCLQALISLNLQVPFLNTGIPDRFLRSACMRYLHQHN